MVFWNMLHMAEKEACVSPEMIRVMSQRNLVLREKVFYHKSWAASISSHKPRDISNNLVDGNSPRWFNWVVWYWMVLYISKKSIWSLSCIWLLSALFSHRTLLHLYSTWVVMIYKAWKWRNWCYMNLGWSQLEKFENSQVLLKTYYFSSEL